jgi:hypothetical protein
LVRRPALLENPLLVHPLAPGPRITEATLSPTRSWQARSGVSWCPCRGLIPPTGPVP